MDKQIFIFISVDLKQRINYSNLFIDSIILDNSQR